MKTQAKNLRFFSSIQSVHTVVPFVSSILYCVVWPRLHAGVFSWCINIMGRPTKYKAEFAEQAMKLCRLGATDKELADFFGVSESTLNKWKLAHKAFSESIKSGKLVADSEVADKLFKRATGYQHEALKIMQYEGDPVTVAYTEHYPPDTTACIFWLKNRQPDKWRDKVQQEVSGPNGGPVTSVVHQATMTPEKLEEVARRLSDEV